MTRSDSAVVTRTAATIGLPAGPNRLTPQSESTLKVVRLLSTKWSETGPTRGVESVRLAAIRAFARLLAWSVALAIVAVLR